MKSWEFSVGAKKVNGIITNEHQIIMRTSSGPAWVMLLNKAYWSTTYVCDFLHKFKLPKFIRNWKRKWDDDDFEAMTFEEYYGDDVSIFWHLSVEAWAINDGINFCNKFIKSVDVDISLDKAEEVNGEPLTWIREWIKDWEEDVVKGYYDED
jgi:hypothetical protein